MNRIHTLYQIYKQEIQTILSMDFLNLTICNKGWNNFLLHLQEWSPCKSNFYVYCDSITLFCNQKSNLTKWYTICMHSWVPLRMKYNYTTLKVEKNPTLKSWPQNKKNLFSYIYILYILYVCVCIYTHTHTLLCKSLRTLVFSPTKTISLTFLQSYSTVKNFRHLCKNAVKWGCFQKIMSNRFH